MKVDQFNVSLLYNLFYMVVLLNVCRHTPGKGNALITKDKVVITRHMGAVRPKGVSRVL